ncbi:MAG TPA: hypothetical protein VIJ94_09310 [Caulobacteraceae bacterium]
MRVVTGADLKTARKQLGWTTYQMALALRLKGDRRLSGQRVHNLEEKPDEELGGPTQVAVEAFLDGYVPKDWLGD